MSTFVTLGLIVAKSAGDEALSRARTRRLLYKSSQQEVLPSPYFVAKRLHEMINGSKLYRKDPHGRAVEAAAPLPTAGPFHLFLSHSEFLKLESSPHADSGVLLSPWCVAVSQIGSMVRPR